MHNEHDGWGLVHLWIQPHEQAEAKFNGPFSRNLLCLLAHQAQLFQFLAGLVLSQQQRFPGSESQQGRASESH